MATAPKRYDNGLPKGIDVDAFLAWARDRAGRFELHDGDVIAMAPERVWHATMKFAMQRALYEAVAVARVPCHVVPDGVAVHVSDRKWYEPDAMVYCGDAAGPDDLNIADPVIVVEVASPSTARLDETAKLVGYFSVASVQHYLIVYPDGTPIVHHQRQADGTILTRLVGTGLIRFNPPGIEIDVAHLPR